MSDSHPTLLAADISRGMCLVLSTAGNDPGRVAGSLLVGPALAITGMGEAPYGAVGPVAAGEMVKARGSVVAEGTAKGEESPVRGELPMGGGTIMGVRKDGCRRSMPLSSRVSGGRSRLQEKGWPYRLHTVCVRLIHSVATVCLFYAKYGNISIHLGRSAAMLLIRRLI